MKFLPKRSHDTQQSFFGKSGITWHIGAYERWIGGSAGGAGGGGAGGGVGGSAGGGAGGNGSIETTVHEQIVDGKAQQKSDLVIGLILQSLHEYKRAKPDVTKVWIKADNAG